jgi:hypothetical protein
MMCAALGLADEQQQSPTIACARALTDLVDTARATRDKAVEKRRREIANRCQVIASQLDATRTRLVQDGADYLPSAWAYVDAGRVALRNYRVVLT